MLQKRLGQLSDRFLKYGLHKSLRLFYVYFCFDKFFEKRNNTSVSSKRSTSKPKQNKRTLNKKTKGQDNNITAYKLHGGLTIPPEGSPANQSCNDPEPKLTNTIVSSDDWSSIWLLDDATGESPLHPGAEQPDIAKTFEPMFLTRTTDPCNPARVKVILSEVTISEDLTPTQRDQVQQVISE